MEKYAVNYSEIKDLPLTEREDFAHNSSRILFGKSSGCLFRATFLPGGYHATHLHTDCDEYVYILSGSGLKGIDDKVYELQKDCAYYLPKGVAHWMLNTHPSEPIEVIGFYPNSSDFDGTGYKFIGQIPENVRKKE